MNNEDLVEVVRTDEISLQYKSPRDQKVLDAMLKVDRKDFLPDITMPYVLIPYPIFKGIGELVKDFLVTYGKLGESKQAPQDECKALEQKLSNQLFQILYQSRVLIYEGMQFEVNVKYLAYYDKVLGIGYGQTCSQPSLVGLMADLLELRSGMNVLEIGSGCGYSAAITSHLIGKEGYLVTIEIIPELAKLAKENLQVHFRGDVEERLEVICRNGSIGCKEYAPFDRIYLTAGVTSSFNSEVLEEQLNKDDGILLYPAEHGPLTSIIYKQGVRETKEYVEVAFVPLIGENA